MTHPAETLVADDIRQAPATAKPVEVTADGVGRHLRYANLDFVRALAILLVVNCHSGSIFAAAPLSAALQLGGKGVELFFVLSGWLLGRQILIELRQTGRVEFRRFWLRRWMRTLPAYYAVLTVISLYILSRGNQPLRWSYLYFGQAYVSGMPYFGISWSLCVEEHFYLVVAPAVYAAWRFRPVRYLIAIALLIPSVCRAEGWYGADFQTHVWYDACATGVLLAAASVFQPIRWEAYRPYAGKVALVGVLLVIRDVVFVVRPDLGHAAGFLGFPYGVPGYALIFASWVAAAAVGPAWPWARVRGVRYLAERSYAIYLLHLEVIVLVMRLPRLPFIISLLLVWTGSVIVAELLYRFVERPGMQLRDRFRASRSSFGV